MFEAITGVEEEERRRRDEFPTIFQESKSDDKPFDPNSVIRPKNSRHFKTLSRSERDHESERSEENGIANCDMGNFERAAADGRRRSFRRFCSSQSSFIAKKEVDQMQFAECLT